MKMTSVAIIMERGGKIALSFRLKTKTFPFCWAFAGGKIENGETELQAAKRELLEETGLAIDDSKFEYIGNCFEGNQLCAIFRIKLDDGQEPKLTENELHTNWYWFDVNDIFKLKTLEGIHNVLIQNYTSEI